MANEKLITLKNLTTYNDKIQDKITAIDNTIAILDAEGDGNSYLANDGTYKTIDMPEMPTMEYCTNDDINNLFNKI